MYRYEQNALQYIFTSFIKKASKLLNEQQTNVKQKEI